MSKKKRRNTDRTSYMIDTVGRLDMVIDDLNAAITDIVESNYEEESKSILVT